MYQKIFKVRRRYNQWVANQTLEDYALRFTARSGRKWSVHWVGQTALGTTAFLALEGIAATVTLMCGFTNTMAATLAVCVIFFLTGLPITYYSAKHGLDIDLLTRGAGFGYLGSTVTSLIYASFTFIFFAIEAAILASALHALLDLPLPIGYLVCAIAVIPIVTHGITAIGRFQVITQWIWLLLQVTAIGIVIHYESANLAGWMQFPAPTQAVDQFDIVLFGSAATVFFAMAAQIGEQVDYLRFMPEKTRENRRQWWFWLLFAGPGWVLIGGLKMMLGSFLAYLAIRNGVPGYQASDPTYMYQSIFSVIGHSPQTGILLAALMVIVSQMKINVTNAYAGSIAWSNFFSRLTHNHPGRVVWLVFNVALALLLMELGIYRALEAILGIFGIVAISWLAAVSADLMINKPLGLAPAGIEFKRAHLYDINPVGCVSMLLAIVSGLLCYMGFFGEVARSLCAFVSLLVCFVCVPLIAWLTQGRYYLARQSPELAGLLAHAHGDARARVRCGICENEFEPEDMSYCPAYGVPICSLCCTLEVRCQDACRPHARASRQWMSMLGKLLPKRWVLRLGSRLGRFVGLVLVVNVLDAALLMLVFHQMDPGIAATSQILERTLWIVFFTFLIVSGVISWLFLLAHESRRVAQNESNRQTTRLMQEIEAHRRTDRQLQEAKEQAERANAAKSRYLSGISHELRTPLQSIMGYAQLLAAHPHDTGQQQRGLTIIQRSGRYLADLIDGLLDISRIEAGKLQLVRNELNLEELIHELAEIFTHQARNKGLAFTCRIHDKLPQTVVTDANRLRQILINLLGNAVKYTSEGQVGFDIRYRNQVAEFVIRDTGPGIDPADQERIFSPFERATSNEHTPGAGLGLTIVRLLTEILGGEVRCESVPGRGSCFRVSLMLPWVFREEPAPPPARQITGYQGARRTLLLVDDDPGFSELVAQFLEPLGFTVAHTASVARARALTLVPDLYLLDINMPEITGLEFARELRGRGVRTPILMLSANAEEQQRPPVQSDYDGYLVKPIDFDRLLTAIGEQLHLRWRYDLPAAVPAQLVDPNWQTVRAYAELGYRKGVEQALATLGDDPALRPHLEKVRDYCARCEFTQIVEYITCRTP